MGSTWEALKRAELERAGVVGRAGAERNAPLEHLAEDVAATRVSVEALEDRVELEFHAFQDEVRQSLAKAAELSASRARDSHDQLRGELAALTDASWRLARRWNVVAVLIGIAAITKVC